MSALTLLSVPASPVPGPPKAASGEAAPGFQSLLAVETGEGSGRPPAPSASGPGPGPGPDSGEEEATAGAPETQGLLTATVILPAPAPTTVQPGSGPSPEGDPAGDVDGVDAGRAGQQHSEPDPAVASDAPQGPTPAPASQITSSGLVDAEAQPRPAADGAPKRPEGEIPANSAGTAVLTEADRTAVRAAAAPITAPLSMPVPAPLRPPADRTLKPPELPVGGAGEDPREAATAPTRTGASAVTPPVTPQPVGSRDAGAPAAAAAAVPASDAAPAEFAPTDDGGVVQTETPAVSREAALSQLSRVTIEATAQIAAQILRRLEGRSTRFEMALTPDELGRVDVKLDIDSEGRLNARLAFDNPAAATDLRGRADELRRQLEDAGFRLGEDALEFAERDSGSSAFDRGHDARNGQSRAFTAAARLNAEIDVAQPPGWMAVSLSPSGVDMKV